MYFTIETNGFPLCDENDGSLIRRYDTYNDAVDALTAGCGETIIPIAKDREEALKWLDKFHGLDYVEDDVAYFMDGVIAEYDECESSFFVYGDTDSDTPIEQVITES